jgi:integrase
MSRVFKPSYTKPGPNGTRITVTVKTWYAEYTDHTGRQRRKKGFADKGATLQLLASLERQEAHRATGLLPAEAPNLAKPLTDLLADYLALKTADQLSAGHVRNLRDYLPEIFTACRWYVVTEIKPDPLRLWMGRKRDTCSPATVNGYLSAVKAFAKWAAKTCGLPASPLADVKKLVEAVDRRRSRRIPTPEELSALLAATERARRRYGMLVSGIDRAMLYRCAAFTGFRASELASLTPASFDLGDSPTVTIAAEHAKGRREESVPLPAHLVVVLRQWLAKRIPTQRLWPGDWAANRGQHDWLKRDVRRAGIAERDAAGQVLTFHGLRAYYVTMCIEAGATVAELQKLARHKSINTTISHYARVRPESLQGIADCLPDPDSLRVDCLDTRARPVSGDQSDKTSSTSPRKRKRGGK